MSDLDTLFSGYMPTDVAARRAGVAAQDTSPDEAARATNLAPQVGLPPSIVGMDPDGFATRLQQQKNNEITDRNPKVASFVSDPNNAAIAKDDYSSLDSISNFLDPGGFQGTADAPAAAAAFGSGVQTGGQQHEYGQLAYRQMKGEPGLEPKLQEYERAFAGEPQRSGFDYLLNSLGGFVGQMGGAIVQSQPEALGGAAVGAGVGSMLGPGAAVTAGTGYAAGLAAGIGKDIFITSAGQHYRSTKGLTDTNGQPLPEPARQVAALTNGAINAGLMLAAGPLVKAGVAPILGETVTKWLAQPGTARAIMRMAGASTIGGTELGTVNAAMEVSNIATTELAKAASGQDFATVFNDPAQREMAQARVMQALKDGVALGAILPHLPIGTNYIKDRVEINQARASAEQRLQAMGALEASKAMQRSPEAMKNYIDGHVGAEPFQIDAQAVAANRDAFAYVPDLDDQLNRELPLGGKVTIGAGDFLTKTDPDVVRKVNDDIKSSGALTVNEANELETNPPNYIEALHASPHSFDAFDISKIGTGQGAASYGHGLYFAENEAVSGRGGQYDREFSTPDQQANIYRVRINRSPDHFLDWDKPFSEQSEYVQNALRQLPGWERAVGGEQTSMPMGERIDLGHLPATFDKASNDFSKRYNEVGVAGIKYHDQNSRLEAQEIGYIQKRVKFYEDKLEKTPDDADTAERLATQKTRLEEFQSKKLTRNFVVFNDKDVQVTHVNDVARQIEEALNRTTEQIMAGMKLDPRMDELIKLVRPKDEGTLTETKPQGLDERLDALGKEAVSMSQDVSPEERFAGKTGLKDALEAASNTGFDLDQAPKSVDWALANNRSDIATAIVERAERNAVRDREAKPGVPEDSPKYQIIKENLAKGAEESEAYAKNLRDKLEASSGDRGAVRPKDEGAPEGQYAAEEKQNFLSPIVDSNAAGMTKPDFARLARHVQDVQETIEKRAYDLADRELKRRDTPLWKADQAKEAEATRPDIENRPDVFAYTKLTQSAKDSVVKLDRNEVDALANRADPAVAEAFRRDGTRFSEQLPDSMFGKNGGHPDEGAELFGFNSGKEMLDALVGYERERREQRLSHEKNVERLVQEEAARRMEEKHGDLTQKIMNEAIDAALSIKQVDVMIDELKVLGADQKITKENLLAKVSEDFGKMDVKKATDTQGRINEAGKLGRQYESNLLKGKPVEAFRAKMQQTLAFAFAREARAFEAERAQTQTIIDRFGKNAVVKGMDQDFTDQIQAVLMNIGAKVTARSENNLAQAIGNRNLERFISEFKEKTGRSITDTDFLHDPNGPPHLSEMNVDQFRAVSATLKSLYNLGREEGKLNIEGKAFEYELVSNALKEGLDGVLSQKEKNTLFSKPYDPDGEGAIEQTKRVGRSLDATLTLPERMALWNDQNNPLGAWNTYFFRPLKEAQHAKQDQLNSIGKELTALPISKDWTKALFEQVKNPFLKDDGRPRKITRGNLLVMLMNSGNDRNLALLAHTMRSDVDTVREFIKSNVTKQDVDVANGMLKIFEGMWPGVRDMTRKMTGVAVEKVEGRGYDTPGGKFEGGYFPSIRDPNSIRLQPGEVLSTFDRRIYDPATNSSAAQLRTGGMYDLDLTLMRLPYIIRQTVHDIHMREPVANAARIAGDESIMRKFTDTWGKEYTDQIGPYLNYVANDGGVAAVDGLGFWNNLSRLARQNMIAVMVGGRLSTASIHGLSALSQSATEVGFRPFLKAAINTIYRNPVTEETGWNRAFILSGEIRNRMHNMYTSMETQVPRMMGLSNARAQYLAFSTRLIGYLDQASAVVVFNARLDQALKAGHEFNDAVYIADQAVRIAHGASGLVDLPGVSRGAEQSRWFTQFLGYFNHTYNRARDSGRDVNGGKYMQAAIKTAGYMMIPALAHMAIRYNQNAGFGEQLAENIVDQMTGGVPGLRDTIHTVATHQDPHSLLDEVFGGLTKPIADMSDLAHGKHPHDWVSHLLQLPGFGLGFLPGISGKGPQLFGKLGSLGDWVTLATTKSGSGVAQFLWDKGLMHTFDPVDTRRLILEGNYHPRKAK